MGITCLTRHTWWCLCISVPPEATHKASQEVLKGAMSARKAAQGSKTETRELRGGLEENSISLTIGSLICPPGKSMIFYPSGPLIFDCSRINVIKTTSLFIQWSRLLRQLSTETESSTLSLPLNDGNLSNDSTFVRFVMTNFQSPWLFMCTRIIVSKGTWHKTSTRA